MQFSFFGFFGKWDKQKRARWYNSAPAIKSRSHSSPNQSEHCHLSNGTPDSVHHSSHVSGGGTNTMPKKKLISRFLPKGPNKLNIPSTATPQHGVNTLSIMNSTNADGTSSSMHCTTHVSSSSGTLTAANGDIKSDQRLDIRSGHGAGGTITEEHELSTGNRRDGFNNPKAASPKLQPPPLKLGLGLHSNKAHRGASGMKPRRPVKDGKDVIFDEPSVVKSYDLIPLLEITKLPRGGVSVDTAAVGRIQYGIPPETIKDSMRLGLGVPSVYIVPVERFCREMGPALGVNLAEFEFPAYFNFFVQRKRCTLIVDSDDAERNIRRVFSETLLGPAQFRRADNALAYEEEDFAPNFPRNAIPDFQKELKHFRMMPDGKELVLETLLKFCHFEGPGECGSHENLAVPPPLEEEREEISRNRHPLSPSSDMTNPPIANVPKIFSDKNPAKRKSSSELPLNTISAAAKLAASSNRTTDDLPEPLLTPQTEGRIPKEEEVVRSDERRSTTWTYSQAKWIGDVARIYANDSATEQILSRTCKRVEIFKMPGGTEYILHDINEHNFIVAKARFSGNVRVSESMSVDGFGGRSISDREAKTDSDSSRNNATNGDEVDFDSCSDDDDDNNEEGGKQAIPSTVLPPTFHPPSFGVTVLGNSHGFDESGSTSGYVLWINGRGVMIDPPPYSSATLEREGIRPRTIVGIILTHCHADHDAGAFQKVLTGSPVAVITTPTIYKSFIRKYAALSALSPALLRHSHRHKPATIGTPLRFQGATFHFTYTLHTIPCVGFRVEWRGRSMVFTGDHFNSPVAINKLEESGVLSKARADDLRNLPLQETDLLLHEAGAPPIHTPLDVLLQLPTRVKHRLYVVHTSALPEGCELKVAPTGTAGTIRLDQQKGAAAHSDKPNKHPLRRSIIEDQPFEEEGPFQSMYSSSEYYSFGENRKKLFESSFANIASDGRKGPMQRESSIMRGLEPPLVSLRPTSSTDAWFILNLLSAVPFLSSLSYASTMEVLETARVDAFCINDVVVPADRRKELLCVVWEGTCMERERATNSVSSLDHPAPRRNSNERRVSTFQTDHGKHRPMSDSESNTKKRFGAVWHAGDWTGPRSLQPEKRLSGDSSLSKTHDIVAMSQEGVKVITVEFANLHSILKSGSTLYRKYLARRGRTPNPDTAPPTLNDHLFDESVRNLNVIELLECNSALRKLNAVQKRHLESLAEGPIYHNPGARLWRAGATVDKAFIVVTGTVSFAPQRRNAGSAGALVLPRTYPNNNTIGTKPDWQWKVTPGEDENSCRSVPNVLSPGETMLIDAMTAMKELGTTGKKAASVCSSSSSIPSNGSDNEDDVRPRDGSFLSHNTAEVESLADNHDYAKLSRTLEKRADSISVNMHGKQPSRRDSSSTDVSYEGTSFQDYCDSLQSYDDDHDDHENISDVYFEPSTEYNTSQPIDSTLHSSSSQLMRRRSSRDRFANKVLGRLYSRRAFTAGLVFSRGHFLGDVSKMVAGLLSTTYSTEATYGDDHSVRYGFGEKLEGGGNDSNLHEALVGELTIHEQEGDQHIVHSSTLAAGKDGVVVLVFPSSSLIPFLNEYPGLLLSLLGTQVVV